MNEWWSKEASSLFPLPSTKDLQTSLNINFGLSKHNDDFNSNYFFNNLLLNDLVFNELKTINTSEEKRKINEKYKKKIKKINENNEMDIKTKNIKIKTANTKEMKDITNINRVTKSLKFQIYPNDKQKTILNNWFGECSKVYNFCVEKYNNTKKYFKYMSVKDKVKIFSDLYKNKRKNTPYDILTDEVRIFFSNLKSCVTNKKNGNIKHYELKTKNTSKSQSIFIPKTSFKSDGFYISHLGKMKGIDKLNISLSNINDSRLIIDKKNKKYYLCVPYQEQIKDKKDKIRVVSIDEGEKIFLTYFSEIGYGYIGKDIRKKILPIEEKIRRYQRILSNKENDCKVINGKVLREEKLEKIKKKYLKKGKKFERNKLRVNSNLRNRRHIKNKINKCYKKIKNLVKELHNKTALYLVKNYERILLPKFETRQMVKNKKYTKEYFNNVLEKKGEEECKKEIREVYKKRRLNGRVKFVLNMSSHYKFKLHLLNKCKEYGSELIEVTEEYTSKTCTNCGIQSNTYSKERIKKCKCNYEINRDVNGARNIMIKNIKKVAIPWGTIHPKERNES